MNETTPEDERGGLSRRDMLRRSALVGGTVVWMAPAVQTLAAPAFAAATTAGGGACLFRIFLKFAPGEGFDNSEGVGNPNCVPTNVSFEAPMITNELGSGNAYTATLSRANGSQLGTASAVYNPATGCVTLTVTGFSVDGSSSFFFIKDGGGNGCDVGENGVFTDAEAADGVITRCDADGQINLSHINFILCVSSNPA